jgi:hypothetical protein
MLAVMAEFGRDVINSPSTTAMLHKREQDWRVGEAPLGSELVTDSVSLVQCDREQ